MIIHKGDALLVNQEKYTADEAADIEAKIGDAIEAVLMSFGFTYGGASEVPGGAWVRGDSNDGSVIKVDWTFSAYPKG